MRPRLVAPLAVLALAAAALAGCSATSTPTASGAASDCAPAGGGSAADAVKVTGAFSADPKVAFSSPLKATDTERNVVIDGTGAATHLGDTLGVEFTVYNGTTGKVASTTGHGDTGTPVQLKVTSAGLQLPGLLKTIECAHVGSRIVGVMPPKDAFGAQGYPEFGIGPKDVVVFVVDIKSLQPTKADGTPQPAPAGFPTVKLAKDGKPTVTFPKGITAPKQTMIGLLKKGDGATVAAGDTVTVQYQGLIFGSGKIFDQSWGDAPRSFQTQGVIPGFTKALVGQKVGSQVIAVIPPADGYGSGGNPQGGITGTDTLVFVIDILSTQHAAGQ